MTYNKETTKPTLEEVWKRKIKTADERKSFRFIFIYEGKIYSTEKEYDTQKWLKPIEVVHL